MENLVGKLRTSFKTNETKCIKWRRDNSLALQRLLDENKSELCDALKKDLHKHELETTGMEFVSSKTA